MANSLASLIVGLLPGKNKSKNKGKAAAPAYVPPMTLGLPWEPSLEQNMNRGTAGAPIAPAPVLPPPPAGGGSGSADWLAMALAAIGGGPDRNAYIAPFEQAAGRAQAAYTTALPQIAQGYDRLRQELGGQQAGVDQAAVQAQQGMAGQQQNTQAQIAAMAAPVLAQLKAAGGAASLGSLTGAMEAQIGTGQAQLAQQGAAQTQLSQNLQAAGTGSYNSRIADSQLAQQSATASAGNNLAQVLNALEAKKAEALQQYAGDSAQYQSRIAQAKLQAAEQQAEADDPGRQIRLERDQIALEKDRMDLDRRQGGTTGPNPYTAQVVTWHDQISRSNPTSYKFLSELMADGETPLPALIGKINAAAKNGKVKYGGKNLDARWLIDRLSELDELEQMEAQGSER